MDNQDATQHETQPKKSKGLKIILGLSTAVVVLIITVVVLSVMLSERSAGVEREFDGKMRIMGAYVLFDADGKHDYVFNINVPRVVGEFKMGVDLESETKHMVNKFSSYEQKAYTGGLENLLDTFAEDYKMSPGFTLKKYKNGYMLQPAKPGATLSRVELDVANTYVKPSMHVHEYEEVDTGATKSGGNGTRFDTLKYLRGGVDDLVLSNYLNVNPFIETAFVNMPVDVIAKLTWDKLNGKLPTKLTLDNKYVGFGLLGDRMRAYMLANGFELLSYGYKGMYSTGKLNVTSLMAYRAPGGMELTNDILHKLVVMSRVGTGVSAVSAYKKM